MATKYSLQKLEDAVNEQHRDIKSNLAEHRDLHETHSSAFEKHKQHIESIETNLLQAQQTHKQELDQHKSDTHTLVENTSKDHRQQIEALVRRFKTVQRRAQTDIPKVFYSHPRSDCRSRNVRSNVHTLECNLEIFSM